jgi:SAM-dependent methyltransferase
LDALDWERSCGVFAGGAIAAWGLRPGPVRAMVRPPMKCKICDGAARHVFDLPAMKVTAGDLIPHNDDGRIAPFYECEDCRFLFSDIKDAEDGFYETEYLGNSYLPEPGSEIQYMRLLHLAAQLIHKPLWRCRILDFGCGVGHFVKAGRTYLGLNVWGFDLAQNGTQVTGGEPDPHIFSRPPDQRFDIVVSREVVEHFTDPRGSFQLMKRLLEPGGVIAFQTNLYLPGKHDRTWDYIGPMNGHISLYARPTLRALQRQLGVSRVQTWSRHDTVVAWKLRRRPDQAIRQFWVGVGYRVYERWRMLRARYG